jgi:uncharacterized protein with HEPN domain
VIKRAHLVRLHDILKNMDLVIEMTKGVDFAAYQRDVKLRLAVERCIEIVSEASRHIPESWKSDYADQPWYEIAAIGNLLRHTTTTGLTISSCGRLRRAPSPNYGQSSSQ